MDAGNFERLTAFHISDRLPYESNRIVIKEIVQSTSGSIRAMAFDYGKVLALNPSSFDTFLYIIEGKAEIVVDHNSTYLQKGDSIIIPGNLSSSIEANHRFKMLSIVLKAE